MKVQQSLGETPLSAITLTTMGTTLMRNEYSTGFEDSLESAAVTPARSSTTASNLHATREFEPSATLDLSITAGNVPLTPGMSTPVRATANNDDSQQVSFAATSTPIAPRQQASMTLSQTLGTTLLEPPSSSGGPRKATSGGGTAASILLRIQAARDSLVLDKTLRS